MIITINNANLRCINGCVYVSISDTLCKEIKKSLPLVTVKDERYGVIFARTTIDSSFVDIYEGTTITFSVVKCPEYDTYVLKKVAYRPKSEDDIRNEKLNAMRDAIREYERRNSMFGIKKVIYNNPATIVYWCDGTKTVVKCGENDIYDSEKGLAMAISKKVFGNGGNYYNQFKKWLPKEETNTSDDSTGKEAECIKKSGVAIDKNPIESENTWGF